MRRELVAIPLANLVVSEPSRRHQDRDKVARLTWNIRSTGQVNPLIVRRIPGEERYAIIAGMMRSLALRAAGKTHAECIVVDQAISEADVLKLNVSENLQRFDPDVMEMSRQVCRFMEASGLNGTETAHELGISKTEVSRCRERVYEWCVQLQQLAENELIAASTGHAIHKIESPEKQQEAMRLAAEGKLTRDAAFLQARETKVGRPPMVGAKSPRVHIAMERGTVTVTPSEFSAAAIVELLGEALRRARKPAARGLRGDAFSAALRETSPAKVRSVNSDYDGPVPATQSNTSQEVSSCDEPQAPCSAGGPA